MPGRTFRIFVSSTFADLREERNALARYVFPKLRALCESRGCKFQPVDLRWGVRDEAATDQQTVRICLEEIARCRRLSPKPNFIVLLGDRYGWRPAPRVVPAGEMETLLPSMAPEDGDLIHKWYRRDDNALPPKYVLQPRRAELAAFEPNAIWEPEESRLRDILAQGRHAPSATEMEILAGALKVEDARDHVFAFFREIKNLDAVRAVLPGKKAKSLIDTLQDGSWDEKAWQAQRNLKSSLRAHLGDNVWEYPGEWTGEGLELDAIGSLPETALSSASEMSAPSHLCEAVWQRLARVLTAQMDALDRENRDPLEVEKRAHEAFAAERSGIFVGRAEPLRKIAEYIQGGPARPLIVHGESGCGKSALMAKAIAEARTSHPDAALVFRFIGAAAGASEIRPMLHSLSQELSRLLGGDESTVPADYPKLVQDFPKRLKLARPEKPLILFLDALDQLGDTDDGRRLVWLPRELPPHVRLIVSTLPDEKYQCFPMLEGGSHPKDLIPVSKLSPNEGGEILDQLLNGADRTVSPKQREWLLERFQSHGSPLFLKLAFEEARRWHSYDGEGPAMALPGSLEGIIKALFSRLQMDHGAVTTRALGYLSASRFGLSDDEMLDLLWRDEEVKRDFLSHAHHDLPEGQEAMPPVVWSRLYFDLEPYLTEREVFGVRLLNFYHRQLAEAAVPTEAAQGKVLHGQLADFFLVRWERPDTHALLELIGQLAVVGRVDKAKEILLDYRWLAAKLKATDVHWLIGDYEGLELERNEPAGLVEGALRLSSHVLAARPEEMAGQLLGRMLDFRQPEVRKIMEDSRGSLKPLSLVPMWRRLDAPGRPLIRTFEGHQSGVSSVAMAPDSRTALSGSYDKTLKLWDLKSGALLRTFEGHQGGVSSVAMAPDGLTAISGSHDKTLKLWDLMSGRLLRTLEGHSGSVNALAINQDGKTAISASDDKTLRLWDLNFGKQIREFQGHTSIRSLAISPNGKTALCGHAVSKYSFLGDEDNILQLWELTSGKLLQDYVGHEAEILAVAYSPDGKTALSASADHTLNLWDLYSGTVIKSFKNSGGCNAIAYSPDGKSAWSGSEDHILRKWDLASGEILNSFKGHQDHILSLAISPGGNCAISGAGQDDKTMRLWELGPCETQTSNEVYKFRVKDLCIIPNTNTLLSLGNGTEELKILDLDSGHVAHTLDLFKSETADFGVSAFALSPDAKKALFGIRQNAHYSLQKNKLLLWDLDSGIMLRQLVEDNKCPAADAIAFTPDGTSAIAAYWDKCLRLWNLQSGTMLHCFQGHTNPVFSVAVSPNGRTAISGSMDRTIKQWDLHSGRLLRSFEGHRGAVRTVAICPYGRTALSGSEDTTIKIWDLATGEILHTFEGHKDWVTALAISSDGSMFGSASKDRTIKIWDLETRQPLSAFTSDGSVTAIDLSCKQSCRMLVAGDALGRVHLFNVSNPSYSS